MRPAVLLVAAAALAAFSAAAQPIVIDDFTQGSTVVGDDQGILVGTFYGHASPGGTILGTERNLKLVSTTDSVSGEVYGDVSSGNWNFVRATNDAGYFEAWWDGQQNNDLFYNVTGLGGISLSGGGRTAFLVTVSNTIVGSGASNQAKLTVYSSGTSASEAVFSLQSATYPFVVTVPFSSFTAVAGFSPASFSSVTLIDLKTVQTSTTGFFQTHISRLATNPDCTTDVSGPAVTPPSASSVTQTLCM